MFVIPSRPSSAGRVASRKRDSRESESPSQGQSSGNSFLPSPESRVEYVQGRVNMIHVYPSRVKLVRNRSRRRVSWDVSIFIRISCLRFLVEKSGVTEIDEKILFRILELCKGGKNKKVKKIGKYKDRGL